MNSNFVIKGNICDSASRTSCACAKIPIWSAKTVSARASFPSSRRPAAPFRCSTWATSSSCPVWSTCTRTRRSSPFAGWAWIWSCSTGSNTYTFPEESKYDDLTYADRAYGQFVAHLRRSATARACLFASLHVPATTLLMEKLEASGLVSYVGKVSMDRNSPDYLREPSVEQALADTEAWVCATRERFANTRLILTPRLSVLHGRAAARSARSGRKIRSARAGATSPRTSARSRGCASFARIQILRRRL